MVIAAPGKGKYNALTSWVARTSSNLLQVEIKTGGRTIFFCELKKDVPIAHDYDPRMPFLGDENKDITITIIGASGNRDAINAVGHVR